MDKNLKKKIDALIRQAKENKTPVEQTSQVFPNSLADHIKTEEQARAFMLLLKNL